MRRLRSASLTGSSAIASQHLPVPQHRCPSGLVVLHLELGLKVFINVLPSTVQENGGLAGRSFRGGTMNPFRYSLNRKRFTSSGLHFSGNSTILENSRDSHGFIVVCSLLDVLHIGRIIFRPWLKLGGTTATATTKDLHERRWPYSKGEKSQFPVGVNVQTSNRVTLSSL